MSSIYEKRINEDTTVLTFTKEELDGCSTDFLDSLKKKTDCEDGQVRYIVGMKVRIGIHPCSFSFIFMHLTATQYQLLALLCDYSIDIKAPEILPVMRKATAENTRKSLLIARDSRCMENGGTLWRLAQLRQQAALIMGYENHAQYQLKVWLFDINGIILRYTHIRSVSECR